MSVTARQKAGNLTPTKSESSYTMSFGQQEPDMQFKMSDSSLHQFTEKIADLPENQRALLTDFEIVCKLYILFWNIVIWIYLDLCTVMDKKH